MASLWAAAGKAGTAAERIRAMAIAAVRDRCFGMVGAFLELGTFSGFPGWAAIAR